MKKNGRGEKNKSKINKIRKILESRSKGRTRNSAINMENSRKQKQRKNEEHNNKYGKFQKAGVEEERGTQQLIK